MYAHFKELGAFRYLYPINLNIHSVQSHFNEPLSLLNGGIKNVFFTIWRSSKNTCNIYMNNQIIRLKAILQNACDTKRSYN